MPKNCCGKNNQYHYNDSCSSEYYSDRSESYNCSGSVDYFTCDPCNFVCYKYPYQPQPPGPPGPPGPPDGFTHLLLLSEYDADSETLFFSIENSILNGATIDAENVVVTIVPPDGAVIDIDSINVEVGSVELDADGNIIWTIGTLAMSDGNPLILSISDYPLPDEEVTWFASAVTTSNSDPNNTDDETELTIGGSSGLGHLDLNLQWDADGGADGEIVVSLLNDGELPAEDIEVILVASNITGLTTGDITPPAGTTVDVVDSGGFTQITWTINLLEAGDNIELRFPQREVLAPDSLSWEGIATTPSFTQTDGENESSILLGLAGFVMEANYDSSNDLVTFNSTYYNSDPDADPLVGPTTITITPDPLGSVVLTETDITVELNGVVLTVTPNINADGVITVEINDDLEANDEIVVYFDQPIGSPAMTWNGTISNADAEDDSDSTGPIDPIDGTSLGLIAGYLNGELTFTVENNGTTGDVSGIQLVLTPTSPDNTPIIDVGDITVSGFTVDSVDPVTGVITLTADADLAPGDDISVTFSIPPGSSPTEWSALVSGDNQQDVEDTIESLGTLLELTSSVTSPTVTFTATNLASEGTISSDVTLTITPSVEVIGDTVPIIVASDINVVPPATSVNVDGDGVITIVFTNLGFGDNVEVEFDLPLDADPTLWSGVLTADDEVDSASDQNTIALDITASYDAVTEEVTIEVTNRSAIAAENAVLRLDANGVDLSGTVTGQTVNDPDANIDMADITTGIITVTDFVLDGTNPLVLTFNQPVPLDWNITVTATNSSPSTPEPLVSP